MFSEKNENILYPFVALKKGLSHLIFLFIARFALSRLRDVGAFLTTSECVILGFAADSSHPKFKGLQKIVMKSAPDTGLLSHL